MHLSCLLWGGQLAWHLKGIAREPGFRTKLAPYDANYASPLIVSMPKTIPEGKVCVQPVNAPDLVVTFFNAAESAGISLGMTFDMGNWHYVGECPIEAAKALGKRVRYVHCKGVQRLPARWVAVPLAESAAPWRALLRALPADVPRAIEYPLMGDDLLAVAREQIAFVRAL